MSTCYRPIPDIKFAQLFDGRLEKYGIEELRADQAEDTPRFLGSCDGVLSASREDDGTCTFTGSIPWSIFDAIAEEFEIELVSEYDHRFWGFATEEEWDNWHKEIAKEYEEYEAKFYNNLIKFVRDEPHDLTPGSFDMEWAEIAKRLVKSDSGLMAPQNREVLLSAVKSIYERDHTEQWDREIIDLIAGRTTDLPKA